jgi:hypothetical protein
MQVAHCLPLGAAGRNTKQLQRGKFFLWAELAPRFERFANPQFELPGVAALVKSSIA